MVPTGIPERDDRYAISYFTESVRIPEKSATLCSKCSQNSHAQIFAKYCDMCGAAMPEYFDLSTVDVIERVGANRCCPVPNVKGHVDQMNNSYLQTIAYDGGYRYDSLVVTPLRQLNTEDLLFIQALLKKPEFS